MKSILWVVDVQNDFMLPNGKLYVKDAEKVIPNIQKAIEWAKKNDMPIFYSADYHYKDSKELSKTPDFVSTFPEHCMSFDKGWELIDQIKPKNQVNLTWTDKYDDDELEHLANSMDGVVILKDEFDVFTGNRNTDRFVEIINPDVVYVCGVVSEICVAQAVNGFLNRSVNVILVDDAIKYLSIDKYTDELSKWNTIDSFSTLETSRLF